MSSSANGAAFARVWVPLIGRCSDAGVTRNEWAVLIALMRWQGHDYGDERITVSQPVKELAETCRMTDAAVSSAVRGLTRKGVLVRTAHGHNGASSRYYLRWDEGGREVARPAAADGRMETSSLAAQPSNDVPISLATLSCQPSYSVDSCIPASGNAKPKNNKKERARNENPSPSLVSGDQPDNGSAGGGGWDGESAIGLLDRHDARP